MLHETFCVTVLDMNQFCLAVCQFQSDEGRKAFPADCQMRDNDVSLKSLDAYSSSLHEHALLIGKFAMALGGRQMFDDLHDTSGSQIIYQMNDLERPRRTHL